MSFLATYSRCEEAETRVRKTTCAQLGATEDPRDGFKILGHKNDLEAVKMHVSRFLLQRLCLMINTLGMPSACKLPTPKRQV